jgi:stage II sporulation protein M
MVKKEKYESTLKALYRRNEKFFAISASIFFISLCLGYFLSGLLSLFLDNIFQSFQKSVTQGDLQLTTQSIFIHNLTSAFYIYGGGLFFGVFTILFLFINGSFIGYAATKFPLGDFLLLTIPHGIFEIIGVVIAGAAGFRLAIFMYSYLDSVLNETWYGSLLDKMIHIFWDNWEELKESLQLFAISVVFLLIAAFIEANLTLTFVQYIKGSV